jgi:hypothetical protein
LSEKEKTVCTNNKHCMIHVRIILRHKSEGFEQMNSVYIIWFMWNEEIDRGVISIVSNVYVHVWWEGMLVFE